MNVSTLSVCLKTKGLSNMIEFVSKKYMHLSYRQTVMIALAGLFGSFLSLVSLGHLRSNVEVDLMFKYGIENAKKKKSK